jgi:hypothetical protein
MSDYQQELERFLDAWERVQRDMQVHEQLERLAARQRMTVPELQKLLNGIDKSMRQLHGNNRPTKAELVDFALKHGKGPNQ